MQVQLAVTSFVLLSMSFISTATTAQEISNITSHASAPVVDNDSENQAYCFSTKKMSYDSHSKAAKELGGHLAVVDTIELNKVMKALAMTSPENSAWIGLNDIETEGIRTWEDGSVFNFADWASGWPIPPGIGPAHLADCVELSFKKEFMWKEQICYVHNHAIYQIPASPLLKATPENTKSFGITHCVNGSGIPVLFSNPSLSDSCSSTSDMECTEIPLSGIEGNGGETLSLSVSL